ncbi:MAG: helix-turn-helix transcriptional regulator [Opitutaceae bacterium]|nr:helix-turn-helix transcriptional regulator [Opitutaceae bacterium]
MLRSLAYGVRDFKAAPDTLCVRYNWIVLCLFDGSLQPRFDPPLPSSAEAGRANFWVIPPQTRYVLDARTRRCDRAVFHFADVPEILRHAAQARGCLAKNLAPAQLAEIRALARAIDREFRHPTLLSELRYEEVLLRLTLIALDHLAAKPLHPHSHVARDRVEQALTWYSAHLAEAPSLRAVAQNVHVSPTHLRRHFHARLGRSPKAVFTKLRMQKAAKLLMSSRLTLDQIAEQCGFKSAPDFSRAFKRHFRVTPGSWRHKVNSAPRAA